MAAPQFEKSVQDIVNVVSQTVQATPDPQKSAAKIRDMFRVGAFSPDNVDAQWKYDVATAAEKAMGPDGVLNARSEAYTNLVKTIQGERVNGHLPQWVSTKLRTGSSWLPEIGDEALKKALGKTLKRGGLIGASVVFANAAWASEEPTVAGKVQEGLEQASPVAGTLEQYHKDGKVSPAVLQKGLEDTGTLAGVAAGGTGGAMLGSALGPWGTVGGGVVGSVVGGIVGEAAVTQMLEVAEEKLKPVAEKVDAVVEGGKDLYQQRVEWTSRHVIEPVMKAKDAVVDAAGQAYDATAQTASDAWQSTKDAFNHLAAKVLPDPKPGPSIDMSAISVMGEVSVEAPAQPTARRTGPQIAAGLQGP